jgi:hypothetical protein
MEFLCPSCGRPSFAPYRNRDKDGKITEGCIHEYHDGELYGESLRWHNRPWAKQWHRENKERLKKAKQGKY